MNTATLVAPTQTASTGSNTVSLTADQQNAMDAFIQFLLDPVETVFVLQGYAGCGKSFLVKELLAKLPALNKTIHLINPNHSDHEVVLTATTNKACEALSQAIQDPGLEVRTIHSLLGLSVDTDFRTNTSTLRDRNPSLELLEKLVFIDEASFVDSALLGHIFRKIKKSKIVFIGDPAQLTPVKSNGTPVFDANFKGAALETVVRQAAGNPIIDLATKFRETVSTGEFFSFKPDGINIQHMDRNEFNAAIEAEFTRPDWKYSDSKILAWTNKRVVAYNHHIKEMVTGDPHFQEGDYAICNNHITYGRGLSKGLSFKTDQMVQITSITPAVRLNVSGFAVVLDSKGYLFLPKSLTEAMAREKLARQEEDWAVVTDINTNWVDLRAAYACTVNKSQGSTYDKVYIDLDDISRCNSGNTIARMLYVAVSRARFQVVFTGDF